MTKTEFNEVFNVICSAIAPCYELAKDYKNLVSNYNPDNAYTLLEIANVFQKKGDEFKLELYNKYVTDDNL